MRKTAVNLKPAVKNLESIAEFAEELSTHVMIEDTSGKQFELIVFINPYNLSAYPLKAGARWPEPATPKIPNEKRPFLNRSYPGEGTRARRRDPNPNPNEERYTFGEAMTLLVQGLPGAKLLINTVKAKCKNGSLQGPELKKAAIAAWCEAIGVDVPTAKDLKEAKAASRSKTTDKRKEVEEQLRSGKDGISKWNCQSDTDKKALDLKKLDLSDAELMSVDFTTLELGGSNLSGANLTSAKLWGTKVKRCNFDKCTSDTGDFRHLAADESSFKNATFKNSKFQSSSLENAVLTNANFTNSAFDRANLGGVDLTVAKFVNCTFDEAYFDEATKFPDDFDQGSLQWAGKGIDPRKLKTFNESHAHEELDFESFMQRMKKSIDSERMKKAVSMLKKETFELFSEVTDESVTGIVKSQRDPELFYSCRLMQDGQYSCCTQNLNVCGGLRGAICKHILVLILGLAKANELNPNKADLWAHASALHQAKLDKDIASQTFLKYKGVEAGEIDWRPTETTPEDFYAL